LIVKPFMVRQAHHERLNLMAVTLTLPDPQCCCIELAEERKP
jgi:hypothetical protein